MAPLTDNMRAALCMMGAMAVFTVNDTCMKALGGTLPLFQAIFLRGLATSVILAVAAMAMGQFDLHQSRRTWGLLVLRSAGEVGAAYFFISALFQMPLANATAILQTLPLAVTLAGALFLREPLGWRRLLAIVVGFGGVLLIVRPGAEGFNHASVLALISVACVTVRDLATRRLDRAVPSLLVALTGACGVTLLGGIGMLGTDWVPMQAGTLGLLAGSTVSVMGGYILSILAMRSGDIGFVAPFRYTSLIWALLLGWVVFAEWPDLATLVGLAIVSGTGLFTLLRERAIGRVADPGPVPLRIR